MTSCTTPVAENMVVMTSSELLYRLRRTTIELLLSDHPNDCMVCVRSGDCTCRSWPICTMSGTTGSKG